MLVRRNPLALQSRDRSAEAGDQCGGREALLESGRVHKRLERGPRLPLCLRRAIESAAIEIAPTDHGADLAVQWIHGDQRALQRIGGHCRPIAAAFRLPLLDIRQRALDLALRRLLHLEIERGVHLEPTLVHALPAETLDELLPHLFLEVLPVAFFRSERIRKPRPASQRAVVRRSIDRPALTHRQQDHSPARDRAFEAHGRRVRRWRFHQTGEQRRLRHVEIPRVLAEETERRRFHAIQAVPEIHLVQVHLEDLVLRKLPFEAPRKHRLLQLSSECFVGGKEALTRKLLRQRAAALLGPASADVIQRRRNDADDVDAAMIVEALVLDRHDRVHQVRRNR